ncbi:MAG: hypothetical protein ABI675_20995 [Chitinophagaceae bacterium]
MNYPKLFSLIKEDFCSLWKYKMRGETIEVITPFSTPSSKFISVFITKRDSHFVITDGGWIEAGEYFDFETIDNDLLKSSLKYFTSLYKTKIATNGQGKIYYLSCDSEKMVSSNVYDISMLISQTINALLLETDTSEEDHRDNEIFRRDVDDYFHSFKKKNLVVQTNKELDGLSGPRFTIIRRSKQVSLVKYITGSTFDYFKKSLNSATIDFQIADKSKYRQVIENKVAIINDQANGYDPEKMAPYIESIEERIEDEVTPWSKRKRLENMF